MHYRHALSFKTLGGGGGLGGVAYKDRARPPLRAESCRPLIQWLAGGELPAEGHTHRRRQCGRVNGVWKQKSARQRPEQEALGMGPCSPVPPLSLKQGFRCRRICQPAGICTVDNPPPSPGPGPAEEHQSPSCQPQTTPAKACRLLLQ